MSLLLKTKVDGVVLPIGANHTEFVSLAGTERPLAEVNADFVKQVKDGIYDAVVEIVGSDDSPKTKAGGSKPAFDPSGETVANVMKYLKKQKNADEIERVQALEAASDRNSVQIANFGKSEDPSPEPEGESSDPEPEPSSGAASEA